MSIELSQVILNHGLTFLAVATGIVVIVVAYFLVKLIMDLTVLSEFPVRPFQDHRSRSCHNRLAFAQNLSDGS